MVAMCSCTHCFDLGPVVNSVLSGGHFLMVVSKQLSFGCLVLVTDKNENGQLTYQNNADVKSKNR